MRNKEKTLLDRFRPTTLGLSFLAILALTGAIQACNNPLADAAKEIKQVATSPRLAIVDPNTKPITDGSVLDLPITPVGTSNDIYLGISNSGKKTLVVDLTGILLANGAGTDDGNFTIISKPVGTLEPGASSSLHIRFSPTGGGAKTATITVPSNDMVDPVIRFTLSGSGSGVSITTTSVSSITTTSASSFGNISDTGGWTITSRGMCWSTSPNPTVADSKNSDGGTTTGSFSGLLTGLVAGSLYYVRAYATNGTYTGYGSQISFTALPAAPSAPTATTVGYAAGGGQLAVSWPAVNGNSVYYDVYYSTTASVPGTPNGPINLSATSCTLTGLANFTNYYVWVIAKNATGSSAFSPSGLGTVGIPVTSVTLSKTSGTFLYGYSETVTATCLPANATMPSVIWSTSNATYGTVSGGTITAGNAAGPTTITATASDLKGSSATFALTSKAFVANALGTANGAPAGGYLFYDKGSYSDGWRYMEAATVNGSGGLYWRNGTSINIPGAYGTDFGTGKANTNAIIAAQGPGNYMASNCRAYTQGGYSDWYMPSQLEANQMLWVVTSINYPSLLGFTSSSQMAWNGCWAFRQAETSPFAWGWIGTRTDWGGYSNYVTRPVRYF